MILKNFLLFSIPSPSNENGKVTTFFFHGLVQPRVNFLFLRRKSVSQIFTFTENLMEENADKMPHDKDKI